MSLVCDGVDPNRNFAFNWLTPDDTGDLGASRIPCSDTYAGPTPFSEPETTALNNFIANNKAKFDVYLSLHSYAHQILYPWGHSRTPTVSTCIKKVENVSWKILQETADQLQSIGEAAYFRILQTHGIEYEVGSTIGVLC